MFIKIFIQFLFIAILISYNIPKIDRDNHINFGAYIFTGIFLFDFISGLFIRVYNQEVIDTEQIIRRSIQNGLAGVVGYAIYIDSISDNKEIADEIGKQNLLLSIIVIIGVGINSAIDNALLSLSPEFNDRLDVLYKH